MLSRIRFDENKVPPLLVEGVEWERKNSKIRISFGFKKEEL